MTTWVQLNEGFKVRIYYNWFYIFIEIFDFSLLITMDDFVGKHELQVKITILHFGQRFNSFRTEKESDTQFFIWENKIVYDTLNIELLSNNICKCTRDFILCNQDATF